VVVVVVGAVAFAPNPLPQELLVAEHRAAHTRELKSCGK
jgi:hypothetical protein